jgi:CRP-like cAMP-binding protein
MQNVYSVREASTGAFLLEKGTIVHRLPDGHQFEFSGENSIFGVAELLLGWENDQPAQRLLDVLSSPGSVIKPVPRSNLKKLIEHYHVGFNINQNLARLLQEINLRLEHLLSRQGERERRSQKYARGYAVLVDHVHDAFQRLRFPFLKSLYDEFSNSLTYQFGLCMMRIPTKAVIRLDGADFAGLLREYPKGAEVCHQGEAGDTLFILSGGELGIYLGELEKPVAVVSMPGEVVGEMSLLLKEPRTATMRAETPLYLSAVSLGDLQQVVAGRPDFFIQLGITLGKRIAQALSLLEQLLITSVTSGPGLPPEDPHQDAFRALERRVQELLREHDFPVLHELRDEIRHIRIGDQAPG